MSVSEMLEILKLNLQITKNNNSNDELLIFLINHAKGLIKKEGIIDDGSNDYSGAVIDYAAFLFRKRNSSEIKMPKHLRYELNNILFSQKTR